MLSLELLQAQGVAVRCATTQPSSDCSISTQQGKKNLFGVATTHLRLATAAKRLAKTAAIEPFVRS
jgi:hypothetical protein